MTHHSVRTAVTLALPLACLLHAGCRVEPKQSDESANFIESLNEQARIAEELAQKADAARLAGDNEKAEGLYRESIEHSAEFPDVWNNLGLLLLEKGELDKALSAFSMAAELDPTDPRPYTNLGVTNMRSGWAEYAIEDFKKALEITPSYLPALRGAIRSADLLGNAEYQDLDRIRRALLAEQDGQWRAYFERQRYLIDARLKSARSSHAGGNDD